MKKKVISVLLTMAMVATMLTGCSSTETVSEATTEEVAEATEEATEEVAEEATEETAEASDGSIDFEKYYDDTVTITCMVWNYADCTASTDQWVEDCKEMFNIEIEIQNVVDGNYSTVLKTKVTAGDMPDIVSVHQITKGFVAEEMNVDADTFADITDLPNVANYSQEVKDDVSIDGELYYQPLSQNALGVLYNTKVFEENNLEIPTNFDDFVALMDEISALGISPLAGSFSEAWSSQIISMCTFDNYVLKDNDGLNALLYDASTNISSMRWADLGDEVDDALNLVLDWMDAGYFTNDPMGTDATGASQMLASGQAAMFVTGNWQYGVASEYCADDTSIGFFALPVNDEGEELLVPTSSNSGMCLTQESENLEAAKIALNYYLSVEIQELVINEVGGVSTNTVLVSEDPFVAELADAINSNTACPYGLFGGTDYLYPRSCSFGMTTELQSICAGLQTSEEFCTKLDTAIAEVADIQ